MKISFVVSLEKKERKKYHNSLSSIKRSFKFEDTDSALAAVKRIIQRDVQRDVHELRGIIDFE
jgi:hypothetical protein